MSLVGEAGALGLYTKGNVKVKKDGVLSMTGNIYGKDVVIEGDLTLRGNIASSGKVEFKKDHTVNIFYQPAPPALTDPFWPMR